MKLKQIQIQSIRNLNPINIGLNAHVNLFFGANGSGKSSFLEAVTLLSCGKSFRTRILRELVRYGDKNCLVHGALQNESGFSHRVGIQKSLDKTTVCKIDQENARASTLLSLFPTLLLSPDSFLLLTGGAAQRRAFLDAAMFHVEHSYLDTWKSYHRALKQRMEAIRQHQSCLHWEKECALHGGKLHHLRERYMQVFLPQLTEHLTVQLPGFSFKLGYKAGWQFEQALEEALSENRGQDALLGFAQYGPHRADITCTVNGYPVKKVLSRGQLKLAVIAFYLAQADALKSVVGTAVTWLIDDVASELDSANRSRVLSSLCHRNEQLLLTAVDHEAIRPFLPQDTDLAMFHVEHGDVLAAPAECFT